MAHLMNVVVDLSMNGMEFGFLLFLGDWEFWFENDYKNIYHKISVVPKGRL